MLVPSSSLLFNPIQTLAGLNAVRFAQGITVTVNEHVASGLSGLLSEAVHVTVVVPTGKQVPDGGEQLTVALPQLSVAVGLV